MYSRGFIVAQYCPNCGNEVGETDKFCKSCGKSLDVETKKPVEIKKPERPISITIAAILIALSAGIEILLGLFALLILFALGIGLPQTTSAENEMFQLRAISNVVVITFFVLILGIIDAAVAYGLWKLKKWAGIVGIILNIAGLFLLFITSPGNLAIAIAGASLGLLTIILIVIGWNSLE